jgi:hypothetical protein
MTLDDFLTSIKKKARDKNYKVINYITPTRGQVYLCIKPLDKMKFPKIYINSVKAKENSFRVRILRPLEETSSDLYDNISLNKDEVLSALDQELI